MILDREIFLLGLIQTSGSIWDITETVQHKFGRVGRQNTELGLGFQDPEENDVSIFGMK
jgi:hypothetical protein